MKRGAILCLAALLGLIAFGRSLGFAQTQTVQTPLAPPAQLTLAERTAVGRAQHNGPLTVWGLHKPVDVVRDAAGVVHLHAQDTHDLFFAQGFVAAQDHMWQMEMWRRSVEGKLAEVLGSAYVQRDKFARMLAFHGELGEELRKDHPQGELVLQSFADGVNAAIHIAVEEQKVPVEFSQAGFQPEPSWSVKTVLTRLPAWAISGELAAQGSDIPPQVLDLAKGSSDLIWKIQPAAKPATPPNAGEKPALPEKPALVAGPLVDGADPGLRMMVQLSAPGWNASGVVQAVLPGISVAAPAAIEGTKISFVETDPANPDRYRLKGQWLTMASDRQLIHGKANPFAPVVFEIKTTLDGPVLYEDKEKHRAYVVQWAGGVAGLGSLKQMQGKSADGSASVRPMVDSATTGRLLLIPEPEDNPKGADANFERVQTDLFTQESPISAAWGDYDNDGWPDLFVGYGRGMVKLFHNDHGKFTDVSIAAGITDVNQVRSVAWGDFDGDGNLDLYVGFAFNGTTPNRLYKGDGRGHFVDVAQKMGINDWGETRQSTFVDFNNDGRTDLLVAFREKETRLYRNDGGHFTEVANQMGITGARSTVGAVWFDYNEDGKLDLFEADQNGKSNVVYRNDGDHFTEVSHELGLDGPNRSAELGSVSIAVGDFNHDGRLDLFYANYGPSWLMRNDAPGKFTDVAPQMGVAVNRHLVCVGWGDYDNDGNPDLYTDGYLVGHLNIRDYLFHNEGDHFTDVTSGDMLKNDADHAVTWVDYDLDGAIDLALANHETGGVLSLYHNKLPPEQARHSLEVLVLDSNGHYTKAGAEVRLYAAGTRQVLGSGQVDTGSSYDGQSALPVHFGLGADRIVDVEVTAMSNHGRISTLVKSVKTSDHIGRPLVVRVP